MRIFLTLALLIGLATAALGQSADKSATKSAEKSDQAAKTEQAAKAKSDSSSEAVKNKNKKGKPKPASPKPAPPKVEPPPLVVHDMSAMKKVIHVIEDSVDLGPTLVVWLLDRTASARGIVNEVSKDAEAFYRSRHVAAWAYLADKPLLTSIVAFDDKLEFLIDPPSPDGKSVEAAFNELRSSSSSREMTFTAIKRSLEKYLPLRTKEHRELVLIVVTDEAGDDGQLVDELIEPLRKQAISVYCVGLPAPWGQSNPFAPDPKAVPAANDERTPTFGPESVMPERVDLDDGAERLGSRLNVDLVDSGFGPFALERLCHETRGQFFALRPEQEASPRGGNARSWPPGNELRFDEKIVAKYAPDYVSAKDYEKRLGESKAKAALVAAAKLPKLKVEGQPGKRFEKDVEAKMAQKMTAAQQFAARNQQPTDNLYNLLLKGESDRAKLISPRWQAEYDLALGRIAASKARLDGYNSMIAALKRGKTFQKSDSKAWMLDPADNYETESAIKKVADKAKLCLERVIKDHPGTPWATIAEEELKTPLGWTWRESP
ncbi:MAG TPA: vWA domain-containing protein [Pirellulaceae bacterium]|jgi:hypothetical protein